MTEEETGRAKPSVGRPAQMAFDLARPPAFSAADFLTAEGNAEALGWIERWPEWPSFALALCGPAGCGKSHLAHIFVARSGGILLAASALRANSLTKLAEAPAIVVEDGDRGVDEIALLHLHNMLREAGRGLLVTGREPASRWPIRLPDLRSRLAAMQSVAIGPPGDDLLVALLVKLLADRQLRVGPDVPAYALTRVERSFAAVRALVAELDAAALAEGRSITIPFVRAVLERTDPRDRRE